MAGKFVVETWTLCDGWTNTFTDTAEDGTETPTTFDSREEAQAEIDEIIAGRKAEGLDTDDEYRVVEGAA